MSLEYDILLESLKSNREISQDLFIKKNRIKPIYSFYGKPNISDTEIQAIDFLEPKIVNISQYSQIHQMIWKYKKEKYLSIGKEILLNFCDAEAVKDLKSNEELFELTEKTLNITTRLLIHLKKLKMVYFIEKELFEI